MRRRDFITALGGAVAWMAAAVSFSAAQVVIFQPPPLKQFLEESGWVSLPLPDKRMGPGSVIKVTKKDGAVIMQWLGDLRRCGISDREFRYVRGKYSAIGIGESFGVKTSIAAQFIAKLEGTADFEKAGGAIMQIEASGGDAVDFDALTNWMAKPGAAQRMPQVCNNRGDGLGDLGIVERIDRRAIDDRNARQRFHEFREGRAPHAVARGGGTDDGQVQGFGRFG